MGRSDSAFSWRETQPLLRQRERGTSRAPVPLAPAYLELDSYLELLNGFDKLNPAWRTPTTALMPVTRIAFWTVMGDGGGYGYRKR